MILMNMLAATVAAAGDNDVLRCPASVAPAALAAQQGLALSLPLVGGDSERSLQCENEAETAFLAIAESWDECPTTRLTRVFVVCVATDGSEATWTRFWYWQRWPTVLGDTSKATSCRRNGRRFTTPQDLHVDGGEFPPAAVSDLAAYLDVLEFWDMPHENATELDQVSYFGVTSVRARSGERTRTVVGGEYSCNPLPVGLDALVGHMLEKPDPVAFLASKRDAIHERLEAGDGQSPGL